MTNPPQFQKVAIIGRTNVGKSTLFNRLIQEKKAIVSPTPGTTRDINTGQCFWQGLQFTLLDTGGLDVSLKNEIEKNVVLQAKLAAKEADLILLVIDVQTGLLPQDKKIIIDLKKLEKPFLIVANKTDNPALRKKCSEINFFGVKNIFCVSSLTGSGTGDLLDEVIKQLSQMPSFKEVVAEIPEIMLKIAIVGKTNVGKSSLLNAVLGKEEVIVSEIPHTTREPHDTLITHQDNLILLIDTAGIRKRAKIKEVIEKESVVLGLRAMKSADLTLLVVDASQQLGSQEKHIASQIVDSGSSIIIIINKWDLIDRTKIDQKKYSHGFQALFPFLTWAPLLFVSAKTKANVLKILDLALEIKKEREKIIPPETLEEFFKKLIAYHRPKKGKGTKIPHLYALNQNRTNPPVFELVLGKKGFLAAAYIKYVENSLRKEFGFTGTPIRVVLKLV